MSLNDFTAEDYEVIPFYSNPSKSMKLSKDNSSVAETPMTATLK